MDSTKISRLDRWARMRPRSRIVPQPGPLQLGDTVGGTVSLSDRHEAGKTITTGSILDIVELPPGAIPQAPDGGVLLKTRSSSSPCGYSLYLLGEPLEFSKEDLQALDRLNRDIAFSDESSEAS